MSESQTPKRPWQGAETRLGIKLFGRRTHNLQQDNMGIGWVLLRLRPHLLSQGDIDVQGPTREELVQVCNDLVLTGAEFRTLREDCGLSLSQAATFFDVGQRVVSRWENQEPPMGPACELAVLRAEIEAAVYDAVSLYWPMIEENPEIDGVDLYRYRSLDYQLTRQYQDGLPHGAHNRILALTADRLSAGGVTVSIKYFDESTSSPDTSK